MDSITNFYIASELIEFYSPNLLFKIQHLILTTPFVNISGIQIKRISRKREHEFSRAAMPVLLDNKYCKVFLRVIMQPENIQPETSPQSAELFHLIVENVRDYAIFMTDAEGRVASWNPGVERLLGYTESEIVGQPINIIFTPEDIEAGAHVREMKRAEHDGRAEDKRWHKRKDGSLFWANGLVMPLKNAEGALRGFAKVMRDDTTKKRDEDNLEQILASITDSFYRFDADFRYTYVNRATTEMFDIPAADFIGKTLWELFPDVKGNCFHAEAARALETQKPVVFENYYEPLDRWFENRVYPSAAGLSIFTTEITTRKRAEKALRQSEERYRMLFESINDGFCVIQVIFDTDDKAVDYQFLEINPAFEKQTGLKEAVGKTVRDFAPNHEEFWFEAFGRIALTGTDAQFEQCAAELNRWFDVYGFRVGEPSSRHVAVLFNDITKRRQAETLLRESEQKFSALAEGMSQLVWMAEADGSIFWYNQNWYEYTGTTPADMEGWGWQAVHDPGLLPQVIERWQASIETGERFEMEFPLKGADGKFRWFLTRVNPLRDGEGRIIRWFGTNTDIDEQRRIARRNQFVIDIDEIVRPLETPEEITQTLARLLGEYLGADRCAYAVVEEDENHFYIPGDYTRGETQSIVGHYSMSDFGAEVLRLMRANQPYIVDDVDTDSQVTENDLVAYRLIDVQSVICVPLHKNNRFSACMAVHQKTLRRWLADEIELVAFVANRFWESIERARIIKSLHESLTREQESRRQAEEANRLKDEFLATLSHELRTPLNAILGWSQILQSRNLSESDAKKALSTIERNARSQNQLIGDILDVSRIITGKLRLDVRSVDLSEIISAVVDAARPAAEAKNIRLQILLDPQAGPISGDPERLQQVIWNLLANAVKFTPKGGRVQIRLERVNSHVEIVVSDTGKGIKPEFLPHVFDRFRQSDGSMTRRHGGLGLGLAIVRQIVELHGGTASVDSAGEGQGATFTVKLPLLPIRREPESDVPRVHPAAEINPVDCTAELDDLRVLLVDDEADSRDLLNLILNSCGASVTTASSASEALKIISGEKFDVIISDIGMPEEDGFSLIKKIRELTDAEGGNVPAIALTAYARSEDRVQALRSGFQMHIAKPVEPSELVAAAANLAGRMRNIAK